MLETSHQNQHNCAEEEYYSGDKKNRFSSGSSPGGPGPRGSAGCRCQLMVRINVGAVINWLKWLLSCQLSVLFKTILRYSRPERVGLANFNPQEKHWLRVWNNKYWIVCNDPQNSPKPCGSCVCWWCVDFNMVLLILKRIYFPIAPDSCSKRVVSW